MRIRPATTGDLPAVEQLLVTTGLPVDGVGENFRDFIVAEEENEIAGVIGLERYGATALLRSAAVAADSRGTGIGGRLVETILERAVAHGVREVYLLTTTAADYFPRFGFTEAPRSNAPEQMRASREFRGACPATAILMMRSLTDGNDR